MTATRRSLDLNALRSKFKSNGRTSTTQANYGNSKYYPFFSAEAGSEAIFRFLPDKDVDNQWFFAERDIHILTINGEKKRIPCLKMYGEACPICKASVMYYKNEGKTSVTGKQLYRSRDWLAQVYVVKDPLPPNPETSETYEGKVCPVVIRSQVYEAVDISLEDVDEPPHDYKLGCNFIARKTVDGNYFSYIRSRFAKQPTALDDETIDRIESEIVELKSLLPAKPSLDDVNSALNAFLNGTSYTPQAAESAPTATMSSTNDILQATSGTSTPVSAAVESKPSVQVSADDEDDEAEAILEQLRNARRNKAG